MFFLLILSDNLRWAHTEIKSLSLPWGRTMKRTNQGVLRLNLGLSPLDSQSQIFIYLFIYVWGFFACPLQRCSKQNYCLIFIFLSVLLLYWTTWLSYLEVFLSGLFIYLFKYLQSELRGPGDWKEKTDRAGGGADWDIAQALPSSHQEWASAHPSTQPWTQRTTNVPAGGAPATGREYGGGS